jgi:thioesterase domain-containing protein
VVLIDSYLFDANLDISPVEHAAARLPGRRWLLTRERERLTAVFRSNLAAARCYEPPPYDGAVVSVRASTRSGDPDAAWSKVARDFTIETVEGDHYSIMAPAALDSLVRVLRGKADSPSHK